MERNGKYVENKPECYKPNAIHRVLNAINRLQLLRPPKSMSFPITDHDESPQVIQSVQVSISIDGCGYPKHNVSYIYIYPFEIPMKTGTHGCTPVKNTTWLSSNL